MGRHASPLTRVRGTVTALAVTVSVGVVASLTACAPASDSQEAPVADASEETGFLDYEAAQQEYRDAIERLGGPKGYTYPEAFREDTGGLFQVGYGEGRAVYHWNCAWAREWLDARGNDPEAAAEALAQYESVIDTRVFRKSWDPESVQKPFLEAVEKAKLGDPSAIRRDVEINCP